MTEHFALREFEAVWRRVRTAQISENRPATDAERDDVLYALEVAEAAERENARSAAEEGDLRVEGIRPPPRATVEIELSLAPAPMPAPIAAAEPDRSEAGEGVVIPTALVEEAMRLHVHKRLGRPKLQAELPGLGDWGARAILHSAKAGEPFGLWLDDDDRLQWGPAIKPVDPPGAAAGAGARANAPGPPNLRLPRP